MHFENKEQVQNLLIQLDAYMALIIEKKELSSEVIYALKAIQEILKNI